MLDREPLHNVEQEFSYALRRPFSEEAEDFGCICEGDECSDDPRCPLAAINAERDCYPDIKGVVA